METKQKPAEFFQLKKEVLLELIFLIENKQNTELHYIFIKI